jgi:hypothetical protein
MDHKKDFENFTQRDVCRIIGEFDDLVMPGLAGTDLLVAGPLDTSVAVARLDIGDAAYFDKYGFGAPETTAS